MAGPRTMRRNLPRAPRPQERGEAGDVGQVVGMKTPPDDLVMVVDSSNCAHVLKPRGTREVFRPAVCESRLDDLAGFDDDLLDLLAAPWSLLTNRQYRAWPPWPCQGCLRDIECDQDCEECGGNGTVYRKDWPSGFTYDECWRCDGTGVEPEFGAPTRFEPNGWSGELSHL